MLGINKNGTMPDTAEGNLNNFITDCKMFNEFTHEYLTLANYF